MDSIGIIIVLLGHRSVVGIGEEKREKLGEVCNKPKDDILWDIIVLCHMAVPYV